MLAARASPSGVSVYRQLAWPGPGSTVAATRVDVEREDGSADGAEDSLSMVMSLSDDDSPASLCDSSNDRMELEDGDVTEG